MKTDELIDSLATDLKPIRRLWSPACRLIGWLAVSLPATAFVVAVAGLRPDLSYKLADPVFLTQEVASLAVAFLAGWAALVSCVPGEPRWKLWTPILPLALWLATIGRQCWDEWLQWGPAGMTFHADWGCLPSVALIGAIPALAMVLALRRGARFHSLAGAWWGTLAAAAIANTGLRLYHMEDAALMVIVWQFGSVLLFTLLAALCHKLLIPYRILHCPS